jgi:predicted nucleotidyltransferase
MISKNSEITDAEFVFLRSFYPEGGEIILKELEKRTGYSYERVNFYLKSLTAKKAVIEKKVGRTLVYSLDFKKTYSKIAYYLYATKRANEFSSKKADVFTGISELPEEDIDLYAIFGSYAKGTEKKDSDIDLLCVTDKKGKIETAVSSIKRRYNLHIHSLSIPRTEFAKINKENPEFWKDFVNYGTIFKGYELFYSYAYGKQSKKE